MSLVESVTNNWQVIIFILGGIFNVGYTMSAISSNNTNQDREIENIKLSMSILSNKVEITQSDFSEIRGDIKSINTKLDLLINNKIKK